jgi:sec-independent protein translocase protein TatA
MTQPVILASLGTPEILLIIAALLLLFGGKKIPELMRGLGKGVKEFKDGKDGVDPNSPTNNENKPL